MPPFWLAHSVGSRAQVGHHVRVVALERTNAGERPQRLGVAGIPQLSSGPESDAHFGDDAPEILAECSAERIREVRVALHRRSTAERGNKVRAEAKVLSAAVSILVCVHEVRVLFARLLHPARKRNGARVADVAPTRVEGQRHAQLEALRLHELRESKVRAEVVLARLVALDDTPPQVNRHAVHTTRLERPRASLQGVWVCKLVVICHGVEREHNEEGNAALLRLVLQKLIFCGAVSVPVLARLDFCRLGLGCCGGCLLWLHLQLPSCRVA
mmetsp:Transcript_15549/g.39345  ORF Transcript_15549/g.39345 Transcript_15549/m.39345 type:complete len:271 (-) Transcript_15549:353-1165(-)